MATPTQEGTAEPAAAGGLPQFDPQWWPGQIFWFLVVFLFVFLMMRFFFVPKIGGAIEERDGKIDGDIAAARRLKDEADAQAQAAAAETAKARAGAQKLASDARAAAQAEVAGKLAAEEAKLNEQTQAAEQRIRAARDTAMGNVKAIATDTAGAIVAKLTGQAASKGEIDAALVGRA
jgi:F-type H+-transporting ATPase subunit b